MDQNRSKKFDLRELKIRSDKIAPSPLKKEISINDNNPNFFTFDDNYINQNTIEPPPIIEKFKEKEYDYDTRIIPVRKRRIPIKREYKYRWLIYLAYFILISILFYLVIIILALFISYTFILLKILVIYFESKYKISIDNNVLTLNKLDVYDYNGNYSIPINKSVQSVKRNLNSYKNNDYYDTKLFSIIFIFR